LEVLSGKKRQKAGKEGRVRTLDRVRKRLQAVSTVSEGETAPNQSLPLRQEESRRILEQQRSFRER